MGNNSISRPMSALKRDVVTLMGYFEPNGSSAPTVVNIPGVKSVAYSTGVYTITLKDTFIDISATVTPQLHAATDVLVSLGDIDPDATGGATIKLHSVKATDSTTVVAITHVAGEAGNRIHVCIHAVRKGGDFSSVS